jgi:hypothetical protein
MGDMRKKGGHVRRAQVVSVTVMIMAMKSVSVKTVKEICSAREWKKGTGDGEQTGMERKRHLAELAQMT